MWKVKRRSPENGLNWAFFEAIFQIKFKFYIDGIFRSIFTGFYFVKIKILFWIFRMWRIKWGKELTMKRH
jgi:hypothetical protein